MTELNETQCKKLDQILMLFGEDDYLDTNKILEIEPNDRKANALLDILIGRHFITGVGYAIGQAMPFIVNLNPAALIFIDNGGFLAEFQKQNTYSNSHTVINIHNNGDGNLINTGNESFIHLNTESLSGQSGPYLEADIIYNSSGRFNDGYSDKNPIEIDENGGAVYNIGFGIKPIIHWRLDWVYTLFIYNNSSHPAFNIRIEQITDQKFTNLSKLPKINNLPPMGKLELSVEFEDYIESSYIEADLRLNGKIPKVLNGLCLQLAYVDERRKEHITLVRINDQGVISTKK